MIAISLEWTIIKGGKNKITNKDKYAFNSAELEVRQWHILDTSPHDTSMTAGPK